MFTAGSLLCAAIGSIHAVAGGWAGLGSSAIAGLVAGAIFLIFYLAGGMGAGDVKLMTAVGCMVGTAPLHLVLLSTVIAGAVFAVAVGIYNGRMRETLRNVVELMSHHTEQGLKPHPELNLTNQSALRLPFALPIAAGCLFTLATLVWEARA
jgi:prepilin peptidase CpaA